MIGVISMMIVGVLTIGSSRPRTQDELLLWLGFGAGLLALFASFFRIASHRDGDWPEKTPSEEKTPEDNEWSRQERARRDHEAAVRLATKASYDYLGKFLALDAAIFALITTFTHLIFMWAG
ncbi:hypothetical protein [Microbacterium sp. LWO12-1.2]|uniref:hypothetical protein n=1 Tax=Microbacterium sp. LWO12-1.2 TaxID=3135261 RepID=UPI0034179B6A